MTMTMINEGLRLGVGAVDLRSMYAGINLHGGNCTEREYTF